MYAKDCGNKLYSVQTIGTSTKDVNKLTCGNIGDIIHLEGLKFRDPQKPNYPLLFLER